MRKKSKLTRDQHLQAAKAIHAIRLGIAEIANVKLKGRVPHAVMAAVKNVERQLSHLCDHLAYAANEGETPEIYILPMPGVVSVPFQKSALPLTVDDHLMVGAELFRLRTQLMELTTALDGHFRKASPVDRALQWPERAVDHLRCKLDDLFCMQHPDEFDTRVYYPGGMPSDLA